MTTESREGVNFSLSVGKTSIYLKSLQRVLKGYCNNRKVKIMEDMGRNNNNSGSVRGLNMNESIHRCFCVGIQCQEDGVFTRRFLPSQQSSW